ncbi:MAG: ferritin-like domain-containing protein [Acidobacteria bacterium]|nr:ferritin-like domain-containing protein [Acidobacteriota bacterium]
MGVFTNLRLNNLEDLFFVEIKDLYDAEQRITKALPKMKEAARSPQLKRAFDDHLRATEGQIERLRQVFSALGRTPEGETCEAMKGLIAESDEIVKAEGDPDVKDAALIAAAQRVEHYEISGYGTARTFAYRIGRADAARLLEATLNEEKQTDKKLTELAEASINVKAERS